MNVIHTYTKKGQSVFLLDAIAFVPFNILFFFQNKKDYQTGYSGPATQKVEAGEWQIQGCLCNLMRP